ncbi:MAG: methionine synthase [Dehalococcoidales bacterium]|nr:methionine synthase [Dehalococcoidales bacterium]RLC60505.1 MAG: methionine synthase [Chloroflexota bacterium]
MAKLEFSCLPTAIGSMPHTDPEEACSLVMKYLPDIPAWPQLPPRSPKENMGIQFSEGFPGIVVNGDKVHIEPGADFETELTQVYFDAEQDNFDKYAVSLEYAAGFHAFLSQTPKLDMVKGQITGPITWGLMVTDKEGLAILYNENLAEATAKFLRLKASWQENALRQISRHTIVFVDEPYLLSLRSVFTSIPEDKVTILLEEVFQGIRGLKGLHCCGNTDWPVLLGTSTDILSMDAYNYASSFSCYPGEVNSFLERGGAIAWGIVPNNEEALSTETVSSLYDRLGEAIAPFTKNGISFKQILRQSLLTPSCGLASLSPEAARQALELVANLSHNLRKKYSV